MPRKTSDKTSKKLEVVPLSITDRLQREFSLRVSVIKNYRPNRSFWVLLIVVGLLALGYWKKGWFVAATVNNLPITTYELNQRLNKLYKQTVVAQMINEKLIEQEAAKKNTTVSDEEINNKLAETAQSYGGQEVFQMLLSQQGLSLDEFKNQTKLQLLVEKMYQSEIKPTDEEITQFMNENKDSPEATNEAKFKITAENQVKQQKLSKVFSDKFQELKKNANIQIY